MRFHSLILIIIIIIALQSPELEGVVFERKDDAFLLRFLRARKFDQTRALDLYCNYYRSRRDYPLIFEEFTHQSVADLLQSGLVNILDNASARDCTKVISTYVCLLVIG